MPAPIAQKSGIIQAARTKPGFVRCSMPLARRGRVMVRCVVRFDDVGHCWPSTRYCTSASSCLSLSELSNVSGITLG